MLLSPTSKKEKRESAPPSARSWIASKFSSSDSGSSTTDPLSPKETHQQQQRRVSVHSNSSIYSPSTLTATQRPLPALPLSKYTSTSAASVVSSEAGSIKVPVDDDATQQPLPSAQILTSNNRLHPNSELQSPHPLSPLFRALSPTSGGSISNNEGRSSLEYQSSMSSNNSRSSSNSHRDSLASLRHHHQHQHQQQQLQQPSFSDPRGDNYAVTPTQEHQNCMGSHRQKDSHGPSYGPPPSFPFGTSTPIRTTVAGVGGVRVATGSGLPIPFTAATTATATATASTTSAGVQEGEESPRQNTEKLLHKGTKTPSEDSLHHHFSNLLQDYDSNNARPMGFSSPSIVSSSISAQSTPVSPCPNTTLPQSSRPQSPLILSSGPSLLSSSLPLSSSSSLSSSTWRVQNQTSSSSSIALPPVVTSFGTNITTPHPLDSGTGATNLQPYFPPPPTQLPHPTFQPYSNAIDTSSTASSTTPTMATSLTATTLEPSRSRRHSSGVGNLSIQTQYLPSSIRKGPATADVNGPPGNRPFDKRPHLKNSISGSKQSTPSHLTPRQSPNHLSIPQKALAPRPVAVQGSSQQYESPSLSQQQRHHHSTHRLESPGGGSGGTHYYNPKQHQLSVRHAHSSPKGTSPSSSTFLEQFQDRTAMALMQRYLTHPDDPDSDIDIAMQIMISQAAVDSKGFEVLVPASVENVKRHHATLSSRIAALTARLSLESKIREAAQSLLKLHADNKKLARQASDHLEAANRKVDQVATELWKLTQLAADLQRTLLQHTSGVLALGVVRLEDQGRRERVLHTAQLQQASAGPDHEEQIEAMSRTISSLESDALEAQALLEDKDRAIGRLMKQLEHQQDMFIKLDEQQQKTIELARMQQMNIHKGKSSTSSSSETSDAKVQELTNILGTVGKRLHKILQLQQQQKQQDDVFTSTAVLSPTKDNGSESTKPQRDRTPQKWSSETTLLSKTSSSLPNQEPHLMSVREDSISTALSEENTTTITAPRTDSGKVVHEFTLDSGQEHDSVSANGRTVFVSLENIQMTLDALEEHAATSQKKMTVLESELGLIRRQSVALSQSRANSVKLRSSSAASTRGAAAEDTIRAALEKSLKDALLEREMARQELENERQRWHDDQNHRIQALEESLVAVEDQEQQQQLQAISSGADALDLKNSAVLELRRQLREAIDEIDVLSLQQQASLKTMRQLFDLLPDSRRKSHLQLYSSHLQLQQQIASNGISSSPKGPLSTSSGRASPAGSIASVSTPSAIGFSMEALIVRVKDLVDRSQQLEQDNAELRQHLDQPTRPRSRQVSGQTFGDDQQHPQKQKQEEPKQDPQSTWILKSDLERLQASAGMVLLLDKELELLKQHTDMLLDENSRLADLAAATTTGVSQTAVTTFAQGGRPSVEKPSLEDAVDELQEIIRAKDTLFQEREEVLKSLERSLQKAQEDLSKVTAAASSTISAAVIDHSTSTPDNQMSDFDTRALEEFRDKCRKLEEQVGEMTMVISALESMTGGPGSGSQILQQQQQLSSSSFSGGSWLSSSLGAVGSLSFGSLTQRNLAAPVIAPTVVPSPTAPHIEAIQGSSSSSHSFKDNSDSSSGQILSPTGTIHGGVSSHAAVAGATSALRREFRRVMHELREEKDKTVRKEVEERRRLERVVRQLRRDLQAFQN